ncbi:Pac1p NDAI_0E00950 [Naumovozyma dairenensis CBS 421]|uniref:Nuclear distribution protein PAC1 n=1 Tax=Naumovozyma dairenensis (strain ATCC 10597 / BCRC 20456 / CBS 421 / NBRC 0211 / NRRL Y-12639) TaxID=1071378 RepID=G0WAZ1_NAUDC|nr:hypothetical protein NDAI_0E00950 [Naumovozyma dairenensis CBS 421]CCD24911.1 hypothetical protein NDAI_0E00950 [Naumovozyma dairenensis CBS 421]
MQIHWKLPLTKESKEDLDRSIIDYVQWQYNEREKATPSVLENNGDDIDLDEKSLIASLKGLFLLPSDNTESTHEVNPLLLPRKWNSIVRLQRHIMTLEQTCRDLTNQVDTLQQEAKKHDNTNTIDSESLNISWIPKTFPNYSITVDTSISSVKLHPRLPIIFIGTDHGKLYAFDIFNPSLPLSSIQAHFKGITSIDSILLKSDKEGSAIISTTSKDLSIKLYKWIVTENKFQLQRSLISHEHIVSQNKLFIHGNDILLASCSRDTTIKIWNTSTAYCINSIPAHLDWVRSIDVFNEYVLSGSQDSSLRLTHWPSGNGLSIGKGHDFPIECVKFIPFLIMPQNENDSKEEEDDDDATKVTIARQPPSDGINAEDYMKLGFKYCASASRDKLIKIWEIPTPRFLMHRPPIPNGNNPIMKCVMTLKGHSSWVKDLQIRGNYLFSCSDDKTIKCWSLENGECVKTWNDSHSGFITCLEMDSDITALKETTENKVNLHREIMVTAGLDSKCNIYIR